MVFGCSRYHLAVADMVCGRYGRTPLSRATHLDVMAAATSDNRVTFA